MDTWRRSFLDKLRDAQSQCAAQFEETLNRAVAPVFEDLAGFLRDNGFKVSNPLQEQGRRSYKAELAENAYLLMIFRFSGVGEFELRSETFVPGSEPVLEKSVGRVPDITADWAQTQFRTGLDRFVDLLSKNPATEQTEALVTV